MKPLLLHCRYIVRKKVRVDFCPSQLVVSDPSRAGHSQVRLIKKRDRTLLAGERPLTPSGLAVHGHTESSMPPSSCSTTLLPVLAYVYVFPYRISLVTRPPLPPPHSRQPNRHYTRPVPLTADTTGGSALVRGGFISLPEGYMRCKRGFTYVRASGH